MWEVEEEEEKAITNMARAGGEENKIKRIRNENRKRSRHDDNWEKKTK